MNAEPEGEKPETVWEMEVRFIAEDKARLRAEAEARATDEAFAADCEGNPPDGEVGRNTLGALLLAMIAATFFAGSLLVSARWGVVGASLCAGIILGEIGLLSVWSVFGTLPWFIRWPLVMSAGELLVGVFAMGATAHDLPRGMASGVALSLPSIFLAAQAPLWLFRFFSNFHFVSWKLQDGLDAEIDGRPGVQHLLGAVTITAIVFGLARLGMLQDTHGRTIPVEMWSRMLVFCGLLAAGSAITVLPGLWAVFQAKQKRVGWGIIGGYFAVAPLIFFRVVLAFLDPRGASNLSGEAIGCQLLAIGTMAAVLLGGLHWIRVGGGYDLVRR